MKGYIFMNIMVIIFIVKFKNQSVFPPPSPPHHVFSTPYKQNKEHNASVVYIEMLVTKGNILP